MLQHKQDLELLDAQKQKTGAKLEVACCLKRTSRQEPGHNKRHRFGANSWQVQGTKPLDMQTQKARVWSW